jgi:hypothetical protein
MQPVARYVLPDGDIVFVFWNEKKQKTFLTSMQDQRITNFRAQTIRV